MRKTIAAAALLLAGCGGASEKPKELLDLNTVPANVLAAAKAKLPDVKFDQAFREPNGDYELRGKDKRGRTREVDVAPDGKVTDVE